MAEEEERRRIELLREIDMEELQVEEVDEAYTSSSDNESMPRGNDQGPDEFAGVMYDLCTIPMYSDPGGIGIDDAHHNVAFLDGGPILNLPMFYVEGVVLLPEAILPFKVKDPRFKAFLDRSLKQGDARGTVGVVQVHKDPENERLRFSPVGTTAVVQQYRLLEDGSFNVLTRGKQRFRLLRRWIDEEGTPHALVQIIQDDLPLRTPRDAFGQLASITNFSSYSSPCRIPPDASQAENACSENDNDSDSISETSFEGDLSFTELQLHRSVIKYHKRYCRGDELASINDSQLGSESCSKLRRPFTYDYQGSSESSFDGRSLDDNACTGKNPDKHEGWKVQGAAHSKLLHRAPRSSWPYWVYRMYDSYCLAQRAAVMWKQIIGDPSMDDFAKKPELLSYHIASKIPVSETLRQELLEIIGVSYRLRREIELLECVNHIRCKTCQFVIAKKSEMLAMSSDDPLGFYANIYGYAHQVKAFYKANGLALSGCPSEEYSWFPGYTWTVATCSFCASIMGWLFQSVNKTLKPESFWAILSSQLEDSVC